ncbi:hypothetical protein NDU88_008585 [Pleurodeles waltl]|uniref:Uncharacterized protein n=1 Tax=Pleurodeles waltl TaxID=8319 RepID=A0AAV7RWI6_PLEWA|nr:hypothetical protein NDU88_008585 [Pleurodeles waltl]
MCLRLDSRAKKHPVLIRLILAYTPSFWSWTPRCLLSRRRSASAPPGLLTAPLPPFSAPDAEIKDGAQAPEDGIPGRPAVQDCTILRRTRLPCSPSLKQAGRQAAAAPGEIATGPAAAAPPASHLSRRGPTSPRLAPRGPERARSAS